MISSPLINFLSLAYSEAKDDKSNFFFLKLRCPMDSSESALPHAELMNSLYASTPPLQPCGFLCIPCWQLIALPNQVS